MANEPLADKQLVCVDCGSQFVFSARDQAFYQERGYQLPRRCKTCRDKRKSAPGGGGGGGMGAGAFGQSPRGGGHSRGAASMDADANPGNTIEPAVTAGSDKSQFKVICSGCGVETTVPFKPDPNRPVYCRNCYTGRRKGGPK